MCERQKAHESVSLTKLWDASKHNTFHINLIKVVKSLYKDSISKIKVNNIKIEEFQVSISQKLFKST